jgi:hypothetical protein
MLPEIRELSDLIFEHAERFPDGDYKKALDLCAAINRTSTEPAVPSSDYGTIGGSPLTLEFAGANVTIQGGTARRRQMIHDQMNQLHQLNDSLELRAIRAHQRLETEKFLHANAKTKIAAFEKRIAEMSVPELREKPTACCFSTLKEACKTDPGVLEKAHKSKCGCCGHQYIVGYGSKYFKSAGKLEHKLNECTHSLRSCATCRRGDAMRPLYGI